MILSSKEALAVAEARRAAYAKNNESEKDEETVLCEFCDSYVEITENGICPNCGGSLKEAIEKENEKKALIKLEMMKIESEMEKNRLEAERKDKMLDFAKGAMVSMVSPIAGAAMLKSAKDKHKNK